MSQSLTRYILILLLLSSTQFVFAEQSNTAEIEDYRTSLNLSPKMKVRQLETMRQHLVTVQHILNLIATDQFEQASDIAKKQFGLTEQRAKICERFNDETFKKLGLGFRNSGDELADVLQKKDTKQSLQALNKTLGYCIQCHANYRQ